jgi:MFS family permease
VARVQTVSLKILAVVVSIFFFTTSLSGSFLPVYYREEMGLSIGEIVEILLFTFIIVGLLPLVLLKCFKNFEGIMSYGIVCTMLFFIVLIYVKSPIVLGLAYGLSMATFWPSFNLLQFRLSETRMRARTLSLFSTIIPSLVGIVGPAVGGFLISSFGFQSLFAVSIVLFLIAFLFSTRIKFEPETHKFSIPKGGTFTLFFSTFIILGLSEAYWIAYPLFVLTLSGTVFQMGLILAASAILICIVTFLVNWLSDVKRARVSFATIGAALTAAWFFALASATTMYHIVALSPLSGFAGAFSLSWFANYGDCFNKENYASILVMMEVGLMFGRMLNLMPTYLFVSGANYSSYFVFLGIVSLILVPFYILSRRNS